MKVKKIKNIYYYILGNILYRIDKTRLNILIPKHIKEQIKERLKQIKRECYKKGHCIYCSCEISKMIYTNKICDNKCYSSFLNRKKYKKYKNEI